MTGDERIDCAAANSKLFISDTCGVCKAQLWALGSYESKFTIINCTDYDPQCAENSITGVPTWIFNNGVRRSGQLTIEEIEDLAGC